MKPCPSVHTICRAYTTYMAATQTPTSRATSLHKCSPSVVFMDDLTILNSFKSRLIVGYTKTTRGMGAAETTKFFLFFGNGNAENVSDRTGPLVPSIIKRSQGPAATFFFEKGSIT